MCPECCRRCWPPSPRCASSPIRSSSPVRPRRPRRACCPRASRRPRPPSENATFTPARRHRRKHRHALVEHVQRPAVAGSRPRHDSSISQVTLNWEAAYAQAFQIQTSTDGTNWTSVYSTTTGTGGNQTLSVNGTGRYVRMYGTTRATPYGYSLWEFQVYGSASTSSPAARPTSRWARPTTASSTGERHVPGDRRDRRQHRHPLVQRVQRPAVAAGRPGHEPDGLPGHAELGGRVRVRRSRSSPPPTAPTGPASTPPPPAPAATRRSR